MLTGISEKIIQVMFSAVSRRFQVTTGIKPINAVAALETARFGNKSGIPRAFVNHNTIFHNLRSESKAAAFRVQPESKNTEICRLFAALFEFCWKGSAWNESWR